MSEDRAEVERLRAENEELTISVERLRKANAGFAEQANMTADEVERLRAIIDRDRELMEADSQEILRLRKERDDLREALRSIAAMPYATDAWEIAREALDPKEDPK